MKVINCDSWRFLIASMLMVAVLSLAIGAYLSRVVLCDQEVHPMLDAQHNYTGVVTYCVVPSTVTYR